MNSEEGHCFKSFACSHEAEKVLQYHVKSEIDGQERIVREDQLERA